MQIIEVRVRGFREVSGRFARATETLRAARRFELQRIGDEMVRVLRDEAPDRGGDYAPDVPKPQAEQLREQFEAEVEDSGGLEGRVIVWSGAPYTDSVIHGRSEVRPVHAKALRFEPGPPGSGFIFRMHSDEAPKFGPAIYSSRFVSRAGRRLQGTVERSLGRIAHSVEIAFES